MTAHPGRSPSETPAYHDLDGPREAERPARLREEAGSPSGASARSTRNARTLSERHSR